MDETLIFPAGSTQGCRFAADYLERFGYDLAKKPGEHVRYLLLDVPSFSADGRLRGGGDIRSILSVLPQNIMICGGNLSHPALEDYETVDFLKDEAYLCDNAYITAECALDVALPYLKCTLRDCPVLIIGWGRIGKCLAQLLKAIGADVTIAARNPDHRAMAYALGYHTEEINGIRLGSYRLIYNTVPYPVVTQAQIKLCRQDCVKIELSSKDSLPGEDIIIARGLPGLHMPESSGRLIANTFLRLCFGR